MHPMSSSLPNTTFITGTQDSHVLSLMVPSGWENTAEPESENWMVHGGLFTDEEPYSMSLRY